jgi:excisionase family DNA binding protein
VDASERLVTTAEAARLLGLSERTLEVWRVTKKPLPFVRVGHYAIRYRLSDIAKWIGSTHRSTSDYMLPDDPFAA